MAVVNAHGKTARLRHLWGALQLVWQSAAGWTVAQAAAAVVQGLLPAASLYLTKSVVDALTRFMSNPAGGRDPSELLTLAPLVVGVTLAGWLCSALSSYASEAQSSAVANHVQEVLQKKALEVDYQCYEDPEFHDTMTMAHGGAASRPVSIAGNLATVARSGLTVATVAVVLLASHAYLAPLVVLAVLPGTIARILNARARHAWQLEHMRDTRYGGYLGSLLTSPGYAKEIRMFGYAQDIRVQWREIQDRLRASRLRMTRKRLALQIGADSLSYAIAGAGIVLIYLRLRSGQVAATLGDLAMIWRAFQRAGGSLGSWLHGLTSLYEDLLFISHYYDFMALPRRIGSPPAPKPLPPRMQSGITVTNLTFRYPGSSADALRGVSFAVKPGEHVALVGRNGAGKTTLAKLLCRLYDPDSGGIAIDGTDIREFDVNALRRFMGVLFQDYARYFMTAGENIRIGDVALSKDDPRIRDAAVRSGADEVIADLSGGYDAMLGRLFPGGAELSVGQWQRLALARALVRNAQFVILDEHTSALDPKAESEVLARLFDSVKGTTAIVVSHRLTTVTMVDRVILLDRGRVAEQGSHDELIRRSGLYAELFSKEARRNQAGSKNGARQ